MRKSAATDSKANNERRVRARFIQADVVEQALGITVHLWLAPLVSCTDRRRPRPDATVNFCVLTASEGTSSRRPSPCRSHTVPGCRVNHTSFVRFCPSASLFSLSKVVLGYLPRCPGPLRFCTFSAYPLERKLHIACYSLPASPVCGARLCPQTDLRGQVIGNQTARQWTAPNGFTRSRSY